MDRDIVLGSGLGDVSRGVSQSRPCRVKRVKEKAGSLGLILVLGLSGLADATYSVARGDNLSRIARRYKISVAALAGANGIRNVNLVKAGRLLRIPGGTPLASATRLVASKSAGGAVQHRVAPGENLTRIAARYRTTVQNLVSMNSLTRPSLLRVGQVLSVPGPVGLSVAAKSPVEQPAPPPPPPPVSSVPVPPQPVNLPATPPATSIAAPAPPGVEDLIVLYSQRYGVDPDLMRGLAWQESGWKQHVVSPAGAIGVMQVLPETGRFISTQLLKEPVNLNDREQNVKAGIRFFAFYLSKTGGDERMAVAGYFQGLRSVWQTGVSERTQKYVAAVMALRGRFAAASHPR